MIVVKIELWPYGNEAKKTEIGKMSIINDGTGSKSLGNYDVKVFKETNLNKIWRQIKLLNFPRKQFGIWELIELSLHEILNRKK
jgi:hypothetical protein